LEALVSLDVLDALRRGHRADLLGRSDADSNADRVPRRHRLQALSRMASLATCS
ncbi:MAG: hypothetical protein H0U28_04165, partial [Nocardioidaceae bacterium]|nr:hypothetical protein [Nocardioidaceae bacterium]